MHLESYQLEYLGTGGTAETYAGERIRIDSCAQRCCVKTILPELRRDADFMKCFQREAAIGAALRHSNIVSLLEADVASGVLVFEFIDGVNLRELIEGTETRRLSSALTIFIAMELSEAFEYAHAQKVVHRDVSASNVMISYAGEVKLLDFGVAKLLRGTRTEPKTFVRGKTQYMAPEQARNHPQIDGRADLFSLGVLCYELLAGRRPATSESDYEIYNQHVHRKYPPLRELVPEVPEALAAIVTRLLEPDRERRFANAAECFDALVPLAPPATVRRDLAELSRNAGESVTRERTRSATLAGKARQSGKELGNERPLRPTSPPTADAVALQRAERPTRIALQDQPTEILRRRPARSRLKQVVPMGIGTAFAAVLLAPDALRSPENRSFLAPAVVVATAPRPTPQQPREQSEGKVARPAASEESEQGSQATAPSPKAVASSVRTVPEATKPPSRPPASQGSVVAAEGTIRVGAIPFSMVWLDAKKIGLSPVEVRVAAGDHVVSVGEKRPIRSRRVTVRADDEKEIYFDLTSVQ